MVAFPLFRAALRFSVFDLVNIEGFQDWGGGK
jgi:hypothetical protein